MIRAWEAEKRSQRHLVAWQTALIAQLLTGQKMDYLELLGEKPPSSEPSKEQQLRNLFEVLQRQKEEQARLKERWTKT